MLHSIRLLKRTQYDNKQQHGFLSQKSTTTSVLDTFNDWSLAIKSKQYVDVAFIDFAKAFDIVSILNNLLSYYLMVLQATYINGLQVFY